MNQLQKSTPNNAIFLDANILLEILLGRGKEKITRAFLEEHSDNLHISTLTAHLVVHFGKAIVPLPVLRSFLADYSLLSVERPDFEWAFTNIRGNDFEDALQLSTAIRNGCTHFVTLDKSLAASYKDLASIDVQLLG